MKIPVQKKKMTEEEYRQHLLLVKRRTMRTVRNTLIAIAILGLGYWALLWWKSRSGM